MAVTAPGGKDMLESLENMGAEEAVRLLRDKIGQDGTVALMNLFEHSQQSILREMHAGFSRMEASMERRFEAVEARMEGMDNRLTARIDGIDARIDGINARIDGINARIDGTLRYAITFALSLLGVTASVSAGIAAYLA